MGPNPSLTLIQSFLQIGFLLSVPPEDFAGDGRWPGGIRWVGSYFRSFLIVIIDTPKKTALMKLLTLNSLEISQLKNLNVTVSPKRLNCNFCFKKRIKREAYFKILLKKNPMPIDVG